MDWRGAASTPLFECLGVLWLLIVSAGLPTDAFAAVPTASKPLTQLHRGPPPFNRTNLSTSSGQVAGGVSPPRQQTMTLFAEGEAGGEGGGPLLLGERSVNRVVLIGRVGLDPDVRQLPSGDRMASFSLATSEQWRDKTRRWVTSDGQDRYTTEVLLSKYKGDLVLLESPEDRQGSGRAQTSDMGPSTGGLASRHVEAGAPAAVGLRSGSTAGISSGPFCSQQQLGSSSRAPRYALPSAHSETHTLGASSADAVWH
ncbi:hypothetical protein ACSSS7_002315 [Eimeria intestinalis]